VLVAYKILTNLMVVQLPFTPDGWRQSKIALVRKGQDLALFWAPVTLGMWHQTTRKAASNYMEALSQWTHMFQTRPPRAHGRRETSNTPQLSVSFCIQISVKTTNLAHTQPELKNS
jgi:hypothetical protein